MRLYALYGLGGRLPQQLQAERYEQLAYIVKADICVAQALPELAPERVEYQDDVAHQEEDFPSKLMIF